MSADYAQTQVVSWYNLITTDYTYTAHAVVDGRATVIAVGVDQLAGKHDLFFQLEPVMLSVVSHTVFSSQAKEATACITSG